MRIANYLQPGCVALRQRADSLEGAVQQLVALLDGTEYLTDTAVFAADVRARLALGGICVGNGLAIPHAKSTAVQLAALTLDPPLPCDTPDGQPLQMLVMIAAPAEANDLHVQVLAELATLFLDADFCTRLRSSKTPEAFCRAIAERASVRAERYLFGKMKVGVAMVTLQGRLLGMDETAREIGEKYHWHISK